MNAALIDLHVRQADAPLELDPLRLAAQERGLDGVLIVGDGVAPTLPAGADDSLRVFAAVELDTDLGRLVCVPGEVDEWFTEAGWAELPKGDAGFEGAALVAAFSERGGAVFVAQPYDRDLAHVCLGDAFVGQEGLAAVVVTSSPRHTTSNERAAAAAGTAKLPGVAGSASTPDGPRFGTVATLFPKAPLDQSGLVAGLKSGRFWPVEISGAGRRKAAAKGRKGKEHKDGQQADKQAAKLTKAEKRAEKKARKRSRKGKDDNRGNQLDISRLSRPVHNPYDNRQPDFDPIARLYGLHDRRDQRLTGRSDDELDRINGNRARGPDGNVMRAPDFRELRAERQHVNLLLQTIDTERQQDQDSIALRFAVASLGRDANDEDIDFSALKAEKPSKKRGGKGKKRHQRRRWRG